MTHKADHSIQPKLWSAPWLRSELWVFVWVLDEQFLACYLYCQLVRVLLVIVRHNHGEEGVTWLGSLDNLGAHFGAQTRITHHHSREPTGLGICG